MKLTIRYLIKIIILKFNKCNLKTITSFQNQHLVSVAMLSWLTKIKMRAMKIFHTRFSSQIYFCQIAKTFSFRTMFTKSLKISKL